LDKILFRSQETRKKGKTTMNLNLFSWLPGFLILSVREHSPRLSGRTLLLGVLLLGLGALPASAQQGRRLPRIGYLYPAGIQRGTSCELTAGGQFLDGVTQAFVSGSGVTVTLLRYDKPLPGKKVLELCPGGYIVHLDIHHFAQLNNLT